MSNDGIESLMGDAENAPETSSGEVSDTATDADLDAETPPRRRGPWLGIAAIALVVVVVIIDAIAIVLAYTDSYETAIVLAFVAIAVAVVAFCLGLAAFLLRAGRWWGLAAMPLSFLVNPYVLVGVLALVGNASGG